MICVLASVYHPYRWVAEPTWRLLDEFWPDHPPFFFCGLASEEAGSLPHIPCQEKALPRSWARFVRDATVDLQQRGFRQCYFLLEDQPPLAPCRADQLMNTLPELLASLGGSYCGLMGWDNRRFTYRAPLLPKAQYRLMHLTPPRAPRFHLHPSLWNLSALEACAELALRGPQQTPWSFEKTCDKTDADLPSKMKAGCYQISAEALLRRPWQKALRSRFERFFFHRLMALSPLAYRLGFGPMYWDAVGFDDFFYEGPYPMFYAGVMSRGRLNPFFRRWVQKQRNPHPLLINLLRAADAAAVS